MSTPSVTPTVHPMDTIALSDDPSKATQPSWIASSPPVAAVEPTGIGAAVLIARMLLGFTFLWAFVDKLFGFGYSTQSASSWLNGGSPTNGFLSHVAVGPFESMFHSLAGNVFVDSLFMLSLLGIGLALVTGVAQRLMAISGTVLMVAMWFAEFPPAKFDSAGDTTSSVNPLVDYHLIYAIAMIMIAVVATTGAAWGLGSRWRQIPAVAAHRILW